MTDSGVGWTSQNQREAGRATDGEIWGWEREGVESQVEQPNRDAPSLRPWVASVYPPHLVRWIPRDNLRESLIRVAHGVVRISDDLGWNRERL
jgi:hypothetical protein